MEIGEICKNCKSGSIVYVDYGDDFSHTCFNCIEQEWFKKGFDAAVKEYNTQINP